MVVSSPLMNDQAVRGHIYMYRKCRHYSNAFKTVACQVTSSSAHGVWLSCVCAQVSAPGLQSLATDTIGCRRTGCPCKQLHYSHAFVLYLLFLDFCRFPVVAGGQWQDCHTELKVCTSTDADPHPHLTPNPTRSDPHLIETLAPT